MVNGPLRLVVIVPLGGKCQASTTTRSRVVVEGQQFRGKSFTFPIRETLACFHARRPTCPAWSSQSHKGHIVNHGSAGIWINSAIDRHYLGVPFQQHLFSSSPTTAMYRCPLSIAICFDKNSLDHVVWLLFRSEPSPFSFPSILPQRCRVLRRNPMALANRKQEITNKSHAYKMIVDKSVECRPVS
jgi:hypothetical protein